MMDRRSGTPPYTEIVLDPSVHTRLDPESVGFLCRLFTIAHPTGDGAWVICMPLQDLARAVGWGVPKLRDEISILLTQGMLSKEPGQRLGRARGSTPDVYYLTHHPALSVGSPPPGSRVTHAHNVHAQNTHVQPTPAYSVSSQGMHVQPRHLIAVPPQDMQMQSSETFISTDESVVDVSSQQQTLRCVPIHQVPKHVRSALEDVGYVGDVPDGNDWDLVVSVARHIKKSGGFRRPGGYLRSLLNDPQKLLNFARSNGLLATSRALDQYGRTVDLDGAMPLDLYYSLAHDNPGWSRAVEVEAARRAASLGCPVNMLIIRQVAATLPQDTHETSADTLG